MKIMTKECVTYYSQECIKKSSLPAGTFFYALLTIGMVDHTTFVYIFLPSCTICTVL